MRLVAAASIVLICVVCPVFSASAEIIHTFTFEPSDVVLDARDGFDIASVEGCHWNLDPGKPMMPVQVAHFSIPAGMRAVGIEILSLDQIELGSQFHLHPAQPPVKLSSNEIPEFIGPDAGVYESDLAYPGLAVRVVTNGDIGGYTVVGIEVYPLQYHPQEGRLLLNRRIEVALVLGSAEAPAEMISGRTARGERVVADRVRALVVNPDLVAEHLGPRSKGDRDATVEYAIISPPGLMDEFQPLADWKTKKGVPAQVINRDWIYATYPGVDVQEQIRNFIKDYEANHGLMYVLIGGGWYKIPSRTAWDDLGYDKIQCELYFSDTDGTWNADGDEYWGEYPEDGVDLYGDVYVGRAPISSSGPATNFVNKILTYEGAATGDPLPTDYQQEMLYLAEILWDPPYTDGGIAKDMIDNNYVPSRFDPITKLYQDDGNLNHTSAMNALNAGQGFMNHCGHANTSVLSIGSGQLTSNDMSSLTNGTRQGVFYSIGCYPAAFDAFCIANAFVNCVGGGGVAFVGNSRYGWGCPGYPGGCVSDLYDQQFFRALFTSNHYRLGITHADAKDHYVPTSTHDNYMRYALYELNLLGDSEMPVWSRTPDPLNVSYPAEIPTGSSAFTVGVDGPRGAVDLACVCLMKGGGVYEIYEVELTDGSGEVTFQLDALSEGTMSVTVTAQDYLPHEGEVTVQTTGVVSHTERPADLVLRQNSPNPFNPVTEIEFGLPTAERISLEVFDVQGRMIATLADGDFAAGYHRAVWRGTDGNGAEVSSGVYFYRLVTGEKELTRKMLLLK